MLSLPQPDILKSMGAIAFLFLFLSILDYELIEPGRYWMGGECIVCVYLFRSGEWIPTVIGAITPFLPNARLPVIMFEYIFVPIFSFAYASMYLYGVAWIGAESDATYVAAIWMFCLTVGLTVGLIPKLWRIACRYYK